MADAPMTAGRSGTTWLLLPLALATLLVVGLTTGLAAGEEVDNGTVDEPDGFTPKPIAPHGNFVDDVSAQFRFRYDQPGANRGATVSNLSDAGTVVVAKVTWDPGGSSGWHTHPGPVIVNITQGALEVTNADDCVTRTYEAGEAWVDPGEGNVHIADNPSDTDDTVVYATFFGVPDGHAPTTHVPPVDC